MTKVIYSFTLFVLFSCTQVSNTQITSDQLKDLQQKGVTIVDIRTESEYASGHIAGVSHNVNFYGSDFVKQMEETFDKNEPIIIHCAKGGRSGKAFDLLKDAGFLKIYDYVGGFNDWKAKGEKIEK